MPEEERRDGDEERGRMEHPHWPHDLRGPPVAMLLSMRSPCLDRAISGVQRHGLFGRHVGAVSSVIGKRIAIIGPFFCGWLSFGIHMTLSSRQQGPYQSSMACCH